MAQRLQPRAEARLRSPDTFCHSADATPLERVEVKDAVCFAESERSQDDGLGLVGPPGHRVPSVGTEWVEESRGRRISFTTSNGTRSDVYDGMVRLLRAR